MTTDVSKADTTSNVVNILDGKTCTKFTNVFHRQSSVLYSTIHLLLC